MTISSRTPDGDPNICSVCGHDFRLEPSIETRDAPCPACGHLLWFALPAIQEVKPVYAQGMCVPVRHTMLMPIRNGWSGLPTIVPVGNQTLGYFPASLQGQWIELIDELSKRNQFPSWALLEKLMSNSSSWHEFIGLLEQRMRQNIFQRVVEFFKQIGRPRYYSKAEILRVAREG